MELNRAVALAMAFGPAAGLELVDALTSEPSLKGCHLLPSVRGDLLAKLGPFDEAHAEFERAAALTRNARERDLLLGRPPRAPADRRLRGRGDESVRRSRCEAAGLGSHCQQGSCWRWHVWSWCSRSPLVPNGRRGWSPGAPAAPRRAVRRTAETARLAGAGLR